MAAPKGTIHARKRDQTIFFQVEGWAQMDLGLALRKIGEQGIARGATTLLIDLQQCAYMDSTFLGTLLFLKRAIDRCCGGRFALVSPSCECNRLLEDMGLNEVFPVSQDEVSHCRDWTAFDVCLDDAAAFQRNCVQAHFELASIPGKAGAPFKKIAKMLAQEMEGQDAKPGCSDPPKS